MKSGTGAKLISKKRTSSYVVTNANVRGYNLKTTVTNDPKEVVSWSSHWFSSIDQSSGGIVIGLEVQYCRNSKKPAILTLGMHNSFILIIQVSCLAEIPDQLRNMFSDKRNKFVGANVGRCVAMLREEYGIIVDSYEDISDIAGGLSVEEFMVQPYTRKVSKIMMELMVMRKTAEIEDAVWEKEELDDHLVAFASLEAHLSYIIGIHHK